MVITTTIGGQIGEGNCGKHLNNADDFGRIIAQDGALVCEYLVEYAQGLKNLPIGYLAGIQCASAAAGGAAHFEGRGVDTEAMCTLGPENKSGEFANPPSNC